MHRISELENNIQENSKKYDQKAVGTQDQHN